MKSHNDPGEWRDRLPWPATETHKHMRGRLGVVSGGALSTGAARLAARAGLRGGAGLVKVFCPPDAAVVLAPSLEAVMLAAFTGPEQLQALAEPMDAVVMGPAAGLTDATAHNLMALARTGAALIVDADALTLFQDRPQELFALLDRDDVLTPHEGEFERLFPGLLAAAGREAAAMEAARRAGAVVVLKGAATVIAAHDGRCTVSTHALVGDGGQRRCFGRPDRRPCRPAYGQLRRRLRGGVDTWRCGAAFRAWVDLRGLARLDPGRPARIG